jgi:glycosyltransferase involved in cell wall biosynthesis
MANGMAIVATRHGGIPEEIEDGESGLLVDENDVEAVAERIVELAGNEGLRRRLGEAARIRARAVFSEDAVRRNWLELLQLDE